MLAPKKDITEVKNAIIVYDNLHQFNQVLGEADKIGASTPFIEFMLQIIYEALGELLETPSMPLSNGDRIKLFKTISSSTASRDLKYAVDEDILEKSGKKRNTTYRYK